MELFTDIKNRVIKGEMVDCSLEWDNEIMVWSHIKFGHRTFNLEINGKVVKSTKTWKPIQNKLQTLIAENNNN